jgi:hypothetical protein
MYCPTCGTAISDKLNYCKSCGARLVRGEDSAAAKSMLNKFLTTISIVILGGFSILVALVAVLLHNGASPKDVGIISVFYLAALTMTSFLLLRLLPKLIDAQLKDRHLPPIETYVAPPIDGRTPAQLDEFRQPVSVVENTTRNFEKMPR